MVLDEADQMLDMGFIHDVKKIIAHLPKKRQSLFFSATMPKTIVELSKKMLGKFERVTIKPEQATAEKVEQGIYFVNKGNKSKLLVHLLEERKNESVLVFSRTKHGANKIVKKLEQSGIRSAAIHGNKSQNMRQKALGDFKMGKLNVLVATDIAARGIDIDELSLVINFDLPMLQKLMSTALEGQDELTPAGSRFSFCMAEERPYLKDIEQLIKQQLPRLGESPLYGRPGRHSIEASVTTKPAKKSRPKKAEIISRS